MDDDDPGRVTVKLPVMRPKEWIDRGHDRRPGGRPPEPGAVEPGRLPARLRPRRVTLPLPPPGLGPTAARIVEILRRPQAPDETVEGAFARRERELAELFRALAPREAAVLRHRLSERWAGDSLAMGFARLGPERRARLLSCLG